MSRSFKKTPICTCAKEPHGKRNANKRVRQLPFSSLFQNSEYKKFYQSYQICDYKDFHRIQDENDLYILKCYKFK